MPSIRDIPKVKKLWAQLPYDKFIVKYTPQKEAYMEAKLYFLTHRQYSHLVVCPDDLEVYPDKLEILLKDIAEGGYETISGFCNIDESQPQTYAIWPLGTNLTTEGPPVSSGSFYSESKKPILPRENDIIQVACSGTACQVISRGLFERISWTGATNGGTGNFDWQLSKDCAKLGVPMYVDLRCFMYHRRIEKYKWVQKFKQNPELQKDGYSFLIKK